MKKIICILLMLLLAVPVLAFQPEVWVHQSSEYTADQNAIVTGEGFLYGIVFGTDDANDITDIKVYDNTTATGTLLLPTVDIPLEDTITVVWLDDPVYFANGISVDITLAAGSCAYMVYYRMK